MWTVKQQNFLLAFQECCAAGKIPTRKEVAGISGVHESTVVDWFKDLRFKEAVRLALRDGLQDSPWLGAEYAAAARAIRGNTREWQLYLEHGGPTSWRGPLEVVAGGSTSGAPGAIAGAVTHVHIHGIPEREPFSSLPPPLTLPAQPVAHPSAPAK